MDTNKHETKISSKNEGVKGGKYLSFALGGEEYGLEILKVREIIGNMDITTIPQTPEYVKGVMNLRGQIIPVIDLRKKFGLETTIENEQNCIIVVEINKCGRKLNTGIMVDSVQEVLDIATENIEDVPEFGVAVDTDFIIGMGKINGAVKILLDIDKMLASNDIESIEKLSA